MEVKLIMKKVIYVFLLMFILLLTSCNQKTDELKLVKNLEPTIKVTELSTDVKKPINLVPSTEKIIALTFNGLADEETTYKILNQLDSLNIKATFFLQGIRVAEEPELAREILKRGHTIQNNTLNHVLPNEITYDDAYLEIALANKVFKDTLKIEPKYVRTKSGDTSDNFQSAASQLKVDVITNTINPQDSKMQSAEEIANYVNNFATRGAIIQLNTYINPAIIDAIPIIDENLKSQGYTLTTLETVIDSSYTTGNYNTNELNLNTDYKDITPNIIENFPINKKQIALTFDDWASDHTVSQILKILEKYDVKATFFLIGKGVEKNPQLARLLLEEGHEIASHSYSHTDLSLKNLDELQKDIIQADETIAEAIQQKPSNYFRPAKGLIDYETAQKVSATGVDYIILYNVTSFDWNMEITENDVYNRVVNNVEPGSIITMHILDVSHTIKVLPRILTTLQQQGYEFKTISELLPTLE